MKSRIAKFRSWALIVGVLVPIVFSSGRGWCQDDSLPDLTVTIDGESIAPPLEHVSGTGDTAKFLLDMDIVLLLGFERNLHFVWKGDSQDELLMKSPGKPDQLVGVRVRTTFEGDKLVEINPLTRLSPAQIRGLWGLEVNHWSNKIAEQLKLIDPDRTCLTIREDAKLGPNGALPELPSNLTTLRIESHSTEGHTDFGTLGKLKKLTSFSLHAINEEAFDCSLLKQSTQLESLALAGNGLKQTDSLAALTHLRRLDLRYCEGLTSVSFAKSMPKLRSLDIGNTQVADLSPLEGLSELRAVTANMTAVRKLPGKVPGLRELSVVSSKLPDADVLAFQRANPKCQVRHHWNESLQNVLASATRLRIRSGGTCHRNEAAEKTLFEAKEADEIRKLLAGIEIVEEKSGFHCMCCGEPSLEFYDGDKLLLTLGFHHGKSLRWVEGWPGDAAITAKSADFLVTWLANRDVTGPLKQREAERERSQADERKMIQATAGLSPALVKAFASDANRFKAALLKEYPEKADQAAVWMRIYGTSNGSWSQLEYVEQLASEQLGSFDAKILESAAEKALLGKDRQLRRGAARLWFSWQSPLADWTPANTAELHKIVVEIQQDARYYPLRMDALDYLAAWSTDFTPDELSRRLSAGLHDPEPQVQRKAMLVAGRLRHAPSVVDLMSVLEGSELKATSLPEVPVSESQDVPDGFGDVAAGCSDAEVAALALADMQHAPARSVIECKNPRTPTYEVALALLGEGQRLKPEHFATENNQELQLAAVRAVVRCKGKYGLKLALDYKQATHWWEGEYVAQGLSQMLLAEKAPGSQQLQDCKNLKVLKEWFDKHGDEYLKRFTSKP